MISRIPIFILSCVLPGLYGCGSIDKGRIQNLNDGKIEVIGHAGSAFNYPFMPFNPLPPNSLASIEKALIGNRADGVEVDVQMTSDSVLILFHDSDLTAVGDPGNCVSNTKSVDVVGKNYITGVIYDLFHDEKVASFASFLSYLRSLEQYPVVHLDVKNFDNCLKGDQQKRARSLAIKIHKELAKYNFPKEKLVIGSSDKNLLRHMQALDSAYSLMLDENQDFLKGVDWVLEHKMKGLVIGSGIAEKEKIKSAHQKGLFVVVFGGRSRSSIIEIVNANPDAIQVNNVAALNDLLDKD